MTAATLLRMMETMNETDRARYFPQGLDTKLSDFYNFIEQRYPEPHRNYVRNTMRSENPEISLRNLLNHTSGIPDINWNLADPNDMRELYSEEKVADGKFLELDYTINSRRLPNERRVAVGTYFYSDPGYELLGMIISAVATHQNGRVVPCQEVMREMVIRRLELGNTFTSDQISFDRDLGRVVVTGSPEKKIARGCVYYNNDLIESLVS